MPRRPYGLSSDPQGVIRRYNAYRDLRKKEPDNEALFAHLIGVLIRLDLAENYDQICERLSPTEPRVSSKSLSTS